MELYVSFSFLSALLSLILAYQIYRLDVNKEFSSFIPVVISLAVWALFSGLSFFGPLRFSILFEKVSFLGIISLPVFLLLFALRFAKRDWHHILRREPWIIWSIPVLSALLVFSNAWHGLFWREIFPDMIFQDHPGYSYVPGPWFWVHSAYSYSLVIISVVLFFLMLKKQRAVLGQLALLVGISVPLATSMLYVFGVTRLDWSPLTFSVSVISVGGFISSRFYLRNIEEVEALQKKTSELNSLYNLVVKISGQLIQSEPDQMESAIQEVLASLGRFTGVDRVYLFDYDSHKDEVSNTYEWCEEGIRPEIGNLQQIPFKEAIPRWRERFFNNEHVYVPRVSDLPRGPTYAQERAILEPQGIQSLIVVPMFFGKKFVGFAGFDSVRNTREWDQESIALLKLCADIIAGSMARVRYERELIQAAREAMQASRSKTEFLTSMTHELRTPLNSIIGFTGIVYEELIEKEHREYLGLVLKSSEALLQLINDLLDFSRAEAGLTQLNPAPVELQAMLDFVADTYGVKAREKGLDLVVEMGENARRTFILDEARLRQVLINLTGNAVKFTHKGRVRILAEARRQPSVLPDTGEEESAKSLPKGYAMYTLEISVEDSGIGIRKEDQEAIFTLFTQLSSGDARLYEGTGMGLNLASRLVKLMGGTIKLESELGRGSRFTVRLPATPGRMD